MEEETGETKVTTEFTNLRPYYHELSAVLNRSLQKASRIKWPVMIDYLADTDIHQV